MRYDYESCKKIASDVTNIFMDEKGNHCIFTKKGNKNYYLNCLPDIND